MNMDLGYTGLIIKECRASRLTLEQAAYVLATAYHESAHTMMPVRETMASTDEAAIRILDRERERPGSIYYKGRGTVKTAYWRRDDEGKSWLGRGLAQLTFKDNYRKASEWTGIDLVADPTKAMNPKVSAKILVKGMMSGGFTGRKLSDYINEEKVDYVNARRTINGMLHHNEIAEHALEYERELRAVEYKPGNKGRAVGVTTGVASGGGAVAVAMPDYTQWIALATVGVLIAFFVYERMRK